MSSNIYIISVIIDIIVKHNDQNNKIYPNHHGHDQNYINLHDQNHINCDYKNHQNFDYQNHQEKFKREFRVRLACLPCCDAEAVMLRLFEIFVYVFVFVFCILTPLCEVLSRDFASKLSF